MINGLLDEIVECVEPIDEREICVHHWIIDPPDGPVSEGICQKCGRKRQFQNYFPHSIWDAEQTNEKKAKILLGEWGI